MKLHHQISGEGSALIILHGLLGTLENWGSQAITLSKSFKVISVDLRNHGRSPHSNAMNYSLMADDVAELMQDLQIQSAAIIGHSMGGKVAMQLALQHPGKVDKLIVVDISPVVYQPHHQHIFNGLLSINLDSLASRASADQQLQAFEQDPGIRAFLLKNLYRDQHKNFAWRPNIAILKKEYHTLSLAPAASNHRKNTELNPSFDKPTLFIKGKNSAYILPAHQESINSLFGTVSYKIIEGAGHWPHAEKPKIFSSIALKFLL